MMYGGGGTGTIGQRHRHRHTGPTWLPSPPSSPGGYASNSSVGSVGSGGSSGSSGGGGGRSPRSARGQRPAGLLGMQTIEEQVLEARARTNGQQGPGRGQGQYSPPVRWGAAEAAAEAAAAGNSPRLHGTTIEGNHAVWNGEDANGTWEPAESEQYYSEDVQEELKQRFRTADETYQELEWYGCS